MDSQLYPEERRNPLLLKLWGLCKFLYRLSGAVIEVTGVMFVALLAVWSVAYLKGAPVEDVSLKLKTLVASPELAYIWIGSFIIYAIGIIVRFGGEIKKGLAKARESKLSAEEKGRSLFKWLIKNL